MELVIEIHDIIIDQSGGLPGIKDKGQLESVLCHIQNDIYYPTFIDKLTHLVHSIIMFHMFNDGNKRTSIALGAHFLNINYYVYCTDSFLKFMEDIVVQVADNQIDKQELKQIITEIIT
ncbi:type II toxin-antitoxin system death-on-curing family toxin [Dolosigranulum pigrum]|nr:type II toxin-antitoxin system death-on-curing family toxin [Dolosigranulum pigrum]QTJ55921.1 type II toxin-antitoxin system death-on-curing family toxin [Dolosigranulum pigrum]RAN53606.1 death-on-curing protein [Dolosigranulum pigrum]